MSADSPRTPPSRQNRFLAGLKIALRLDGDEFVCEAYNLSRTGILVTGSLPDPTGKAIEINLGSTGGDLMLSAQMKLARAFSDIKSGGVQLGLEFPPLDAERQATLDALVNRVIEGMAPAPLAELDPAAPVEEIREALGRVPLAHRITLATRAALGEREILRHDESPHVLDALARNPQINLNELKELLRNGDLLPTALEHIARNGRWRSFPDLMVTVATHPRVPLALAMRIADGLNDMAKSQLLRKPGLPGAVRTKLMADLSRKRPTSW
ncbi:MAG: PilZ domain-containing protein [bacterium]|nr:PilZ domain-containing protein [bacterium]